MQVLASLACADITKHATSIAVETERMLLRLKLSIAEFVGLY